MPKEELLNSPRARLMLVTSVCRVMSLRNAMDSVRRGEDRIEGDSRVLVVAEVDYRKGTDL